MFAPDMSPLITSTLVPLFATLALLLLAMAFAPAIKTPWSLRSAKVLARKELSGLRLARMLDLRGVPLREFIAMLRPAQLEHAASNCRNCANVAHCEAVLHGYLPRGDFAFCPNRDAIRRVVQLRLRTSL